MKYYRFMSEEELIRMLNGDILENLDPHNGCITDSEGFCFLREDSTLESQYGVEKVFGIKDEPWASAYEILAGNITSDYFVEFETSKELKEGFGRYANVHSDDWFDYCSVKEYSTVEYSTGWMIPTRIWQRKSIGEYVEFGFQFAFPDYYEQKYDYLS